jgi:hypothetical protein
VKLCKLLALAVSFFLLSAQSPIPSFPPGVFGGRGALVTSGGGGLGLQTNLAAFWEFQTTSWLDSTANANNLTGSNSPTTTTGIVGNAIGLVSASSQSASVASNSSLQVGAGSYSVQAWVKGNACGPECFVAKSGGGFANNEFGLGSNFTSNNFYACSFYNLGGSETTLTTATVIDSTTFHHIVMTWNSTTKVLTCYVDNVATTSTLTGQLGLNSTAPVYISGGTPLGIAFTNGAIDQVGIWKARELSVGDVNLLWNGGSGLSYAAMNFLLKRDVLPGAANDNTPMFLNLAA